MLDGLKAQLTNEASSFKSHWRDLSDFVRPRRSRFFVSDANRGDARNQKIIDSTATLALRAARSGMMSGITSPARPWFKLSFPDPELAEFQPVKQWLSHVERRMRDVHLRSNLYNVLPYVYGDMFQFGTGCLFMEEDFDDVVRFLSFPIGSYMIANDEKLRVSVFMREFQMTVRQLVEKFGVKNSKSEIASWDNFSDTVRSAYMNNNTETWVQVTHAIVPNPEHRPGSPLSKHKKYLSCYYESASTGRDKNGDFLREKGYDYFPVLAPRWEVTGEDVYGTNCPGMEALGDIKQLQLGEKRAAQAIEKMINPPMVGPTSLQNANASILPGDITYVDDRQGLGGFRAAHEVRFDLNSLEAKQQQVRNRISRAYFEDLFLMLANDTRSNITATEIAERKEEKLLALGPVLEQVNQDLLDPLIDNTFTIMNKQGLIPEPPEEIEGQDLKVEYVSIMAQAQKLAGIGSVERFVGFAGNIAQQDPSVAKKINLNEVVDVYADLTGVPVQIVRTNEQVEEMLAQEQAAAQRQAQMEQAQAMISGAKELSQTSTEEGNALNELIQRSEAGSLV